jgi:hypothetical protein|nr:hypothetical protein [Candidatus Krumholzibacteria bacterium]
MEQILNPAEQPWWGPFDFGMDETRLWRLGSLELWVSRFSSEVRVTSRGLSQEDEGPLCAGELVALPDPTDHEDLAVVRYGVRESDKRLQIMPATADRAVVVKSEKTFIVPPGGAISAFVSSPLWVRVDLDDPVRPMYAQPTNRPSDTWFGPSTIEGELCYAIRTSVRFNLENLPVRPHRAISVVRILNHGTTPLPLERLRIPLPLLSLFAGNNGRVWTEAITLERNQDDNLADIKLGHAAPTEAGPCTLIAPPRATMDKRDPIRTFTGLLGLRKSKEGYERIAE